MELCLKNMLTSRIHLEPSRENTVYLEETMQNANRAWWRDIKIYKSEEVRWRVKCTKDGGTCL